MNASRCGGDAQEAAKLQPAVEDAFGYPHSMRAILNGLTAGSCNSYPVQMGTGSVAWLVAAHRTGLGICSLSQYPLEEEVW